MTHDVERIESLETKLAFQEDTISTLNDALVEQQTRLDHLEAMLKLVVERLGRQPDDQDLMPAQEPPPPHY